jgi:UDP-N-acetylmuramate--alanine ligase
VVEADEFDRSFLTLHPELAVITSTDADHLDIYGNAAHVVEGFQLFAQRVVPQGTILLKKGVEVKAETLAPSVKCLTYSIEDKADYMGTNIRIENGFYIFDLITPERTFGSLKLGLAGRHNVENAVAASAMALLSGIDPSALAEGLAQFKGVQRRFETIIRNEKMVYIDDYAHHPTELNAAISSAKELFPNKKITGIFQPHLFSRTRDFMEGFASSLSLLDKVILLPIYPAREQPIEGITSNALLALIPNENKMIMEKSQVVKYLSDHPCEVLLTLGAGDIDTLVEPIKKAIA